MKTMKQKGTENMVSVKNTARKSIWLAWVILSVGLIATIVTTIYVKMDVEADAKRKFALACNQIQFRIDERMSAHEQIRLPDPSFRVKINKPYNYRELYF